MKNKEIITWLIVQDLKHLRLACPKCNAGRGNEPYFLSIFQVILKLFEVDSIMNEDGFVKLSDVYYGFLQSDDGKDTGRTDEAFTRRAEHCYQLLVACIHMQSRIPKTGEHE